MLIMVPSEKAVIDPRESGGDGRYINHSCKPNCELHEIRVRNGRIVIGISALEDLDPDTECTMKYKWRTGKTRNPVK